MLFYILNTYWWQLFEIFYKEDELIEVTPKNIRLRKKELDPSMRNKLRREAKGKWILLWLIYVL